MRVGLGLRLPGSMLRPVLVLSGSVPHRAIPGWLAAQSSRKSTGLYLASNSTCRGSPMQEPWRHCKVHPAIVPVS